MCQIPFQDNVRVRQKNIVDGGIDRIFAAFLKSQIMAGYFDKKGVAVRMTDFDELVEAAHFKGKGFQFVNPLVQAQSLILLNEAGHLTRQQVQDQLPHGMSVEKLFLELANENDEMELLDLHYGEEIATDPVLAKGGSVAPGTEKPAADEMEEGGAADKPPKSKVQSPRTRQRRLKIPMQELLRQSTNGSPH
jgi:capsid protein